MPMSDGDDPAGVPAGELFLPPADGVLWYHRALCRVALPIDSAGEACWKREAAGVVLSLEAVAAPPAGPLARLLLMYVLDSAKRRESAVVPLGADAAALLGGMGLTGDAATVSELGEQAGRLFGAHAWLSWDGAPPLALFDGRGRGRATGGWRSSVRVGSRLYGGLAANTVALERPVLRALAGQPLALDLYAWLASEPPEERPTALAWSELQARFGAGSTPAAEFRATMEQALMQVQQVWPRFALVLRDDGVVFRAPGILLPEAPPPPPPPATTGPADDPELLVAELESELGFAAEPHSGAGAEAGTEPGPSPETPRPAPVPERVGRQARLPQSERQGLSLKSQLTGLPQVVWLQRSAGRDNVIIEVTPGGRYDPELSTVIVLEPVTLQVAGGLYARDFERVAAWVAVNRDLIDDWWDSRLTDAEEALRRVKKVPAPAWR
jgi:hypothetical protein